MQLFDVSLDPLLFHSCSLFSSQLFVFNLSRQVSSIVDNLKLMAMDMGDEMDRQNVQIDRVTDKVIILIKRTEFWEVLGLIF